jgi:hypothetical protein
MFTERHETCLFIEQQRKQPCMEGFGMRTITRLLTVLTFTGWAGVAQATPISGIESCSTTTYERCTFEFQGTLSGPVLANGTNPVGTLGPVRVEFVRDPFMMPHLETIDGLAFNINFFDAPLGWEVTQFYLGFIDGMGNTGLYDVLNATGDLGLEEMGNKTLFHGFEWYQEWTCFAACQGGTVFTTFEFDDVKVGEWEKAPLPSTLALFALGLAGLMARRRI